MATARARHGSYLFQRSGSQNWYVKLRSNGVRVEQSLHTSDKHKAEVLAGPLINAHKAALLAAKPRVEMKWERQYEPGMHTGLNGEKIYATESELHFLDETPIRIEPNGFFGRHVVGAAQSAKSEFDMLDAAHDERPKVAAKNSDDETLELYFQRAKLSPHFEREARAAWSLYKELGGKPLKSATRDDGRLLVKHFENSGNKTGTIAKKIGWLRAMCEFGIGEGRLTFNPFSKIIPNSNDELRRKPLSDADIEACKKNLGKLRESDQLLFRVLACTGMRLGEAFQIDGEQIERDVRYVVIGTKTEASLRRVPLPESLLPYLRDKIAGPLFTGNPKAASRRLNDFLNDCGLTDPSIVVHSLRHRAADRLRAYECPIDIRHALLGHETRSVAEGYGAGFSVPQLKMWIDKIGF